MKEIKVGTGINKRREGGHDGRKFFESERRDGIPRPGRRTNTESRKWLKVLLVETARAKLVCHAPPTWNTRAQQEWNNDGKQRERVGKINK